MKKGISTLLTVCLTAVVTLAIAAGSYYFINKQNQAEKEALQSQIDELSAKVEAGSASITAANDMADATKGWKTYNNTTDGYSIKYPADWHAEYSNGQDYPGQEVPDAKNLYISENEIVACTEFCAPSPHANALEIDVSAVQGGRTLTEEAQQYVAKYCDFAGISCTQQTMTIGGQSAVKVTSECDGLGCGNPDWIVVNGERVYFIRTNLAYQGIFDTIVSTLEF